MNWKIIITISILVVIAFSGCLGNSEEEIKDGDTTVINEKLEIIKIYKYFDRLGRSYYIVDYKDNNNPHGFSTIDEHTFEEVAIDVGRQTVLIYDFYEDDLEEEFIYTKRIYRKNKWERGYFEDHYTLKINKSTLVQQGNFQSTYGF